MTPSPAIETRRCQQHDTNHHTRNPLQNNSVYCDATNIVQRERIYALTVGSSYQGSCVGEIETTTSTKVQPHRFIVVTSTIRALQPHSQDLIEQSSSIYQIQFFNLKNKKIAEIGAWPCTVDSEGREKQPSQQDDSSMEKKEILVVLANLSKRQQPSV